MWRPMMRVNDGAQVRPPDINNGTVVRKRRGGGSDGVEVAHRKSCGGASGEVLATYEERGETPIVVCIGADANDEDMVGGGGGGGDCDVVAKR